MSHEEPFSREAPARFDPDQFEWIKRDLEGLTQGQSDALMEVSAALEDAGYSAGAAGRTAYQWITGDRAFLMADAASVLRSTTRFRDEAAEQVKMLAICAARSGMPKKTIAERLGVDRATVYRALGMRSR